MYIYLCPYTTNLLHVGPKQRGCKGLFNNRIIVISKQLVIGLFKIYINQIKWCLFATKNGDVILTLTI